MYTHSYSFNPVIRFHVHSHIPLGCLIKQNRNNYPYNHKFLGNTVNRTRELWLDKCIQTSSSTFFFVEGCVLRGQDRAEKPLAYPVKIYSVKETYPHNLVLILPFGGGI